MGQSSPIAYKYMQQTHQIFHLVAIVLIHMPTQSDMSETDAPSSSQNFHTVTYIDNDDVLEVHVGFQRSHSDNDCVLVDAALIEAIHGMFLTHLVKTAR